MAIFGGFASGAAAFAATVLENPSTASPFADLISDPDSERVHIVHFVPRDPVGDADVDLYYADAHFEGPPAAFVRMRVALELESAIFEGFDGSSGSPQPRSGAITIHAQDVPGDHGEIVPTDLDALAGYLWDGRDLEVLLGGPDDAFEDFEVVFVGKSLDLEWERRSASVIVRDPSTSLQKPLQQTRYAGTGGLEGGSDLAGKTKPVCLGLAQNLTPTIVDRTNNVVGWHDGRSFLVGAIQDNGVPLIYDGDVADVYAAPTPTGGHYITDLVNSVALLGAPPEGGTVTMTALGEYDGTTWINRPDELFAFIAKTYGGYTDAGLDLQSFYLLNSQAPYTLGLYFPAGGQTLITEALDAILPGSVLGTWEATRFGTLRVVRLAFANTPSRYITAEQVVGSPRRLTTPPPDWRRTLLHSKSLTVQTENQLALGDPPTAIYRNFVAEEYRRVTAEDTDIRDTRDNPGDTEIATLIQATPNAQTEVDRQFALTSLQRDRYQLEVWGHQFLTNIGDTVNFTYPLWGLASGKDFIVTALRENTFTRSTRMTIWG